MNYQNFNAKTIDSWCDSGWEWGKSITHEEFENAKIYVDLFPCNECAKLIIQSGIKEVIYLSDKYNGTDENIASKRLFDTCKVKYKQIECKEITI